MKNSSWLGCHFFLEGVEHVVEALSLDFVDVHDGAVSVSPVPRFQRAFDELFDQQRRRKAPVFHVHVVLLATDESAADVIRGVSQDDDRVVSELARSLE